MPGPNRTKDEFTAIRERVLELAAQQGGVFRPSDLAAWGLDANVLHPMIRRTAWVRLHHGVYTDARMLSAPVDSVERHLLQCAASVCALSGRAYAFGPTAAVLHGLPIQRGLLSAVQLIRPIDSDGRALRRRITSKVALDPARIRSHDLSEDDVTVINGIPTVNQSLAAVSTAALSRKQWAVATLDGAAWERPDAILAMSDLALAWSHLRGIATVRAVLPLVRSGAQTPLESLSRLRLVNCGLPEPELQAPLHDRAGLIGYVDMFWPKLGVVGEADGLLKYESRNVLVGEKAREDRIRSLGIIVVRWTWEQIMGDPASVARRVHEAAAISLRRTG